MKRNKERGRKRFFGIKFDWFLRVVMDVSWWPSVQEERRQVVVGQTGRQTNALVQVCVRSLSGPPLPQY